MADVAVVGGPKGMEFIENPFTINGELSQKADYIITHSTITRREIIIADPDCIPIERPQSPPITQQEHPENLSSREEKPTTPDCEDEVIVVTVAPAIERPPENNVTPPHNPRTPVRKPETVEAEVKKVDAAQPQQAEEVRLKKKRCCNVL